MHMTKHPIATDDNVATAHLTSWHYGKPGTGKKVYIQASLHADEVPAMLVAHFLRQELEALDAAGKVKGEVILVPAANPLGLAQVIHGTPFGRYDLGTGVNFNRAYGIGKRRLNCPSGCPERPSTGVRLWHWQGHDGGLIP